MAEPGTEFQTPLQAWRWARPRRVLLLIWLFPGSLFAFLHIQSGYRLEELNPLWGVVAAVANFAGPWAPLLLYPLGFPNAGLREFYPIAAIGSSIWMLALIALALRTRSIWVRVPTYILFAVTMLGWYAVGFWGIAAGLM